MGAPERLLIGGIEVCVFGRSIARKAKCKNPGLIFVTHGRNGSAHDVFYICEALLARDGGRGSVLGIVIEQRNHGRRMVDEAKNGAWSQNPNYANDIFAIQYGTALDIKFLVEVLPTYFGFTPSYFGVCGLSIGGYTALLTMAEEPKITMGVCIIGYADFKSLIDYKAVGSHLPLGCQEYQKRVNSQLLQLLKEKDPVNRFTQFADRPLLMIYGGNDRVIPSLCNDFFVRKVREVYSDPESFAVIVHDKVGHELTTRMVDEAVDWFLRWSRVLKKIDITVQESEEQEELAEKLQATMGEACGRSPRHQAEPTVLEQLEEPFKANENDSAGHAQMFAGRGGVHIEKVDSSLEVPVKEVEGSDSKANQLLASEQRQLGVKER